VANEERKQVNGKQQQERCADKEGLLEAHSGQAHGRYTDSGVVKQL
jgi:hypothetical protein